MNGASPTTAPLRTMLCRILFFPFVPSDQPSVLLLAGTLLSIFFYIFQVLSAQNNRKLDSAASSSVLSRNCFPLGYDIDNVSYMFFNFNVQCLLQMPAVLYITLSEMRGAQISFRKRNLLCCRSLYHCTKNVSKPLP